MDPQAFQIFKDKTLSYLASRQGEKGEFKSFETYPTLYPDQGWLHIGPSPFIHANILLCLQQIGAPAALQIRKKGCDFLLSLQELGKFWRYWPHEYPEIKVPLDMDDTCLSSFVLTNNGHVVNNRSLLLRNQGPDGYFNTWIFPGKWLRFKWGLNKKLKQDLTITQQALELGYLAPEDREPAVAANILLYLGNGKAAQSCIQQVIKEISSGTFPRQYYDEPLAVYYHIARAYAYGISEFAQLKPVILQNLGDLKNRMETANPFQLALCLNILTYYGEQGKTVAFLAKHLMELEMAGSQEWEAFPYFNSKNRLFWAGSPALTAVMVLEGVCRFQKLAQT